MKRMTIAVGLEQPGTDDLTEITLQADNRDMVRFDLVRSRKSWPASGDAPVLWATVVAYFALLRSGEIPKDETVEQFIDRTVTVSYINPDDGTALTPEQIAEGEGQTDVDPSLPGVEPGY